MPLIPFNKYHGAGNDFIMIDDREGYYDSILNEDRIAYLCHRRFGIGADGLILLQHGINGADFFMKYFNSDGRQSTFCGNGGRCIVAFASLLGIDHNPSHFLGTDGWHDGLINPDHTICLSMRDVSEIQQLNDKAYTLYTGSPHYVAFVEDIDKMDVPDEGRKIRNNEMFFREGINVNFIDIKGPGSIRIRTYERGVEDETMACGTGVVASALAYAFQSGLESSSCEVETRGGKLKVEFQRDGDQKFSAVRLIGPAVKVFEGSIEISQDFSIQIIQ